MTERTIRDRSSLGRALVAGLVSGAYLAAFVAFGRPLVLVFAVLAPLVLWAWLWGYRGAVWQSLLLVPLVGGGYFFGRGVSEDPLYVAVGLTLAMGLSMLVGSWSDRRHRLCKARAASE